MKNIFDILPSNFFNLLSSSSDNVVHAGCLCEIYDQYELEVSYRINRKQLRDALTIYLLENHFEVSNDDFENDADGKTADDATKIISKFIKSGWIIEETDDSTYEKYIIMTETGIALAEFLISIEKPETVEYSSYIFNIYNTLKNEEQWKSDPYVGAIKNVYKNAKSLAKSLKRLSTFIRKEIEKIVSDTSLSTLTDNLLSYCSGDFIREYARLNKQQNIHNYRGYIRKRLDDMINDRDTFETIIIGCAIEENMTEIEAEDFVLSLIDATKRFLTDDYENIMRDIKHKINMHIHLAVGRIRFIQTHGHDSKGCVEEFLRIMKDNIAPKTDLIEVMPEEMLTLFRLERNEYLDINSITYPKKDRVIRKPVATKIERLSDEEIQQALQRQQMEAYNPYSKELMKKYIESKMGTKKSINCSELPLETKEDLLAAISSVAYGQDNGLEIKVNEGYVETDTVILRDFEIVKK